MNKFLMLLFALFISIGHASAESADGRIGAGDGLKMSVFGNPDLSLESKVSQAGTISFPLIGEVNVAGLTVSEAEKKISGMLESGGFIRKPQVNINVTMLQSQQVSLLGQINRPGRYPLDGKRNLTDMIALAGGVSADSGDTVTLIRNHDGQTTRQVINIAEMMRSGDVKQNIQLENNDVIFVDRAPRFYVFGEVQHPGTYRLERNMTVLQVLSAGGGLSPRGTLRGVKIKRRDATGQLQMVDVKIDDLVQMDDVVFVQESLF